MKHHRLCILAGLLAPMWFSSAAVASEPADIQARIFNYFLDRAEKGDMSAQFIVGFRYENGSGTERDATKAVDWYQKAAAQGHEQARQRLGLPTATQESTPAEANVSASVPAVDKESPKVMRNEPAPAPRKQAEPTRTKPKETPKPVVVKRTVPTPKLTEAVVVKAPVTPVAAVSHATVAAAPVAAMPVAASPAVETPATLAPTPAVPREEPPQVNAMDVLLAGKWARNETAPDYLPSRSTSCLQAGSEEIVCFSEGAHAQVGGNAITYSVKATMSEFSASGDFRIHYMFNVLEVAPGASTATPDRRDLYGLAAQLGWQQPGLTLDCSVKDSNRLACTRDGKQQMTFYRQ